MATTIQISNALLQKLKQLKLYEKESYEEVIVDLIEDRMELSKETKRNIEKSEKEIVKGQTVSIEKIKERLGL